jgi:hypothetical protein
MPRLPYSVFLFDCEKKARATGNSVAFIEHEKVLIFKVKVKGFPPRQAIAQTQGKLPA